MRKKPDILAVRIAAQSKLFCVEEVDLKFSNGALRTFERMRGTRGRATIMVAAIAADRDTVYLVREYGVGLERYEIGLPKGIVEEGEELTAAANRELQEEIGFGAKRLTLLKQMTQSPGYMKSSVHLVLAEDLYPATAEGDEPEPIEVVPWKLSQLDDLILREDCTEARSIAGLYLVKNFLKRGEKNV